MNTVDISKATKQVLAPIFGREFVSVTRGKGTAASWIRIKVMVPRPFDCHQSGDHWINKCQPCREVYEQARNLIDKATEAIEYGSYYADDGYNSCYSTTNIHIEFDGGSR